MAEDSPSIAEIGTPVVPSRTELKKWLAPYTKPSVSVATYQLITTSALYVAGWAAMYASLSHSYWLTLLLAIPTATFMIRLFIFQHDCGHGSFLPSQKVNNIIGSILGVVTLMPYLYWRKTHAIHHATSGNLEHRGFGDITTITVSEYKALKKSQRLGYRIYRNPLTILLVGPIFQFVLKHRLPMDLPRSWKREWRSIHKNNLAIMAILVIAWATVGLKAFFAIQIPVIMMGGSLGVFLFYVQHQYEETYWRSDRTWDYYQAGLWGSSYLALPRIGHWLTGNIGYHHIHHLSSKIPNYRLAQCFKDNHDLQNTCTLSLWSAVKTLVLSLWDEDRNRLVSFGELRRREVR